jgi:2-polyprenyl-6-methoxyphenol hydroxylase-like FAD-dependent oxidoreductase
MRGRLEVAGGGIAGLTVGLAFARKGWSVRVHEQDNQLRIPGAGIYIWENGLRVLQALGVLDAVSAGAIPATRHEKRDHDGRAFASAGFAPDSRLIVPLRSTLLTALWHGLFPHLGWIIDRIPDEGRGDWFEILKLRDWAKGRVAIIGDAASAQPPFLGQGGGCAMMSALSLAHMVTRENDVPRGIAAWQRSERRFTEWVQKVAYWYGQLAFMPPALRNAAFRMIGASSALKR